MYDPFILRCAHRSARLVMTAGAVGSRAVGAEVTTVPWFSLMSQEWNRTCLTSNSEDEVRIVAIFLESYCRLVPVTISPSLATSPSSTDIGRRLGRVSTHTRLLQTARYGTDVGTQPAFMREFAMLMVIIAHNRP